MNTWWTVADRLESPDMDKAQFGLEVVAASEMPDEVKREAEALMAEVANLRAKLKAHSKHVLSKMDGVMWPAI